MPNPSKAASNGAAQTGPRCDNMNDAKKQPRGRRDHQAQNDADGLKQGGLDPKTFHQRLAMAIALHGKDHRLVIPGCGRACPGGSRWRRRLG